MALWELSAPVFVGTFLALVAVLMMMGKTHKLLRGPMALASWIAGGGERKHRCKKSYPKYQRPYPNRSRKAGKLPKHVFVVPTPEPAVTDKVLR